MFISHSNLPLSGLSIVNIAREGNVVIISERYSPPHRGDGSTTTQYGSRPRAPPQHKIILRQKLLIRQKFVIRAATVKRQRCVSVRRPFKCRGCSGIELKVLAGRATKWLHGRFRVKALSASRKKEDEERKKKKKPV